MTKLTLAILLSFLGLIFPTQTLAVCPVCTVAVGAGLGISRWIGIDDTVSGAWVGGPVLSSGLWLADWIGKKGWRVPQKEILSVLVFFLFVLPFLWQSPKLLTGTAIGSLVFILAVWLDRWLRRTNNDKVYIYYQKVIIPVFLLTLISFIFYLVI